MKLPPVILSSCHCPRWRLRLRRNGGISRSSLLLNDGVARGAGWAGVRCGWVGCGWALGTATICGWAICGWPAFATADGQARER
jgi:hypothetical protein